MFKNREEAGKILANRLSGYKGLGNAIVLGLPRGGVVVAYEVARLLKLPLDIVVPRKIGAPGNKELAIGAITPDGSVILDKDLCSMFRVEKTYIDQETEKERTEAIRRLKLYRKNRPELDLNKKVVILVDDGIATGATIRAAIKSVRASGVEKVIVAVPVAPTELVDPLAGEVDDIVCLDTPQNFFAVGAYYKEFGQVEDGEVIAIMEGTYKKESRE